MTIAPFKVRASSSFYGPLLILPKARRHAMMQLYGFCRVVDDIADSDGHVGDKMTALGEWQRVIESGTHEKIEKIITDFSLDRAHFHGIIEGMRMDVQGQMLCPPHDMLMRYCDYVAGCVGQLAICIFGAHDPQSKQYAHALGRALQLTNILRDVMQDAQMGRIYMPHEAFEKNGLNIPELTQIIGTPSSLKPVCADLASQANDYFKRAHALILGNDQTALQPAHLMAILYQRLLKRMIADDWTYQTPYRVTASDKALLVWKYVTGTY